MDATPRYAKLLRAEPGKTVRGILLAGLFEVPMHWSKEDGGVPCRGRGLCGYCPKRVFYRWYGPAALVEQKTVNPTAEEMGEWERCCRAIPRRTIAELERLTKAERVALPSYADPPRPRPRTVLVPCKPAIAEWPDRALEVLGDRGECRGDIGRRVIEGLGGLAYELANKAGLHLRILEDCCERLPEPFPVEPILERIFGLPLFPPEEPQDKPDTIPFKKTETGTVRNPNRFPSCR